MGNRAPRNDNPALAEPAPAQVAPVNRIPSDTQAFMTSFFQQNEDLGVFGLIAPATHPNHRRVRAHINKTRAVDIPFDIKLGSLEFKAAANDPNKWVLQFSYESSELVKSTIWLQPRETRMQNEFNLVENVSSEVCAASIQSGLAGKEVLQQHTIETDIRAFLSSIKSERGQVGTSSQPAAHLLLLLESDSPTPSTTKRISKVYLYYRIDQSEEGDCSPKEVSFVLEKKAIQYGRRFLWLKNIYDHTSAQQSEAGGEARPSTGTDDKLCTVCYTNPINTVVVPCRHFCLCVHCSKELKRRFHK